MSTEVSVGSQLDEFLKGAMTRHIYLVLIVLLGVTAVRAAPDLSSVRSKRLTTDDVFHLEELGKVAFSPDGKWLAYVLKRPKIEAKNYEQYFLQGNDRADVWVVSTSGSEQPKNLTKGEASAGYWNPVWSPDSQRLAVLSTRDGNVRLWVVDLASGTLKHVMAQGMNTWLEVNPPVWISEHILACAVLPEGKKSLPMSIDKQMAEVSTREWPKAWAGTESTANVLDSGVPSNFAERPKGALLLVDVQKGTRQVIAEGEFDSLTISPDKHYVAALETLDVVQPEQSLALRFSYITERQLAVFSADGKRLSVGKIPATVVVASIRWAPDGSRLALVARAPDKPGVYVYRIGSEGPQLVTGDDLMVADSDYNPAGVLWSYKNDLFLRAEGASLATRTGGGRFDWWALTSPGQARNLTISMKMVPSQLVAQADGNAFIGLAEGKLWKIFADGSTPVELALRSDAKVASLEWPVGQPECRSCNEVVVGLKSGSDSDFYRVDLSSGDIDKLAKPKIEAELSAYCPNRKQIAFTANTGDGSYLWLAGVNSATKIILKTNTFLGEIGRGEVRKIEYRGLDGQELKGWLILPPDYQQGIRYPTVTWVYAGAVWGDTYNSRINSSHALNLQLLASHGYAVLVPSMPLKSRGEADDPYLELTKGVLPAIDKAIELGIADPQRLAVMGHSYGGYSTYGLITQTNRFKAAIAMAGLSDLISLYGTFDSRFRYEDFAHERLTSGVGPGLETDWGRMGGPPWNNWNRYLRNSPIYYIDKVETPLLIVQGDMDQIPIAQGEEFFTALYRQGKRARFIRYWGEGHVLDSPANIRDFWMQAYAWLDEFCDISRNGSGRIVFDRDKPKSRYGTRPLTPQDFVRFDELQLRSRRNSVALK